MDTERAADLPVVEPPSRSGPSDNAVVGVLLAAGTGSRFGDSNKLLATFDGEPLVRHAGRTLAGADLTERIVVVGADGDRVRSALSGFDVRFVHNPHYTDGQATSLRAGLQAARPADAVVFALGDMPLVAPASVNALIDTYAQRPLTALAAAYDGRRGNPVLFDSTHFGALETVSGDTGGRRVLLTSDRSALVETGDPGVLCDVDTTDDLRRLTTR